jgi:hypothetical protein
LACLFAQWGLDMVGKLHNSWPEGHVYLLVAVDKFTKWIEVVSVTTQDSTAAVKFIQSIVFFGLEYPLVSSRITVQTSSLRSSRTTTRG